MLLAEHREVFPELPLQSLQVLSDGTCHGGRDLPLLFIEEFTKIVKGLVVVLNYSSVPHLELPYCGFYLTVDMKHGHCFSLEG